jgi:hypothetical protein
VVLRMKLGNIDLIRIIGADRATDSDQDQKHSGDEISTATGYRFAPAHEWDPSRHGSDSRFRGRSKSELD